MICFWLIGLTPEVNHRFFHSTLRIAVFHPIFIRSVLTEGQCQFFDVADDHNILLGADFFGAPEHGHGHILVRTTVTATYNLALEKTRGNGCCPHHPLTAHVNLSLKMLIFIQDHELNYSIQFFFFPEGYVLKHASSPEIPLSAELPVSSSSSLWIPPYLIHLKLINSLKA